MSTAAAITGIGMVSALGHDAVTSCAAARAGLVAAAELKVLDFSAFGHFGKESLEGPPTVSGHEVRGLADGFAGVGKTIMMGARALADLQSRRRLSEREAGRTGLCINVADYFIEDVVEIQARTEIEDVDPSSPLPSAAWQRQCDRLIPRLIQLSGVPLAEQACHIHYGGHAGMVASIEQALTLIRSGAVDRCIVGGIDSRIEALFILSAAQVHVLKTNQNPVGLMPGEAAAFFLLERPGFFDRQGNPPLGYLGSWASAADAPFNHDLPRVTGMCQAVRAVAASDPQAVQRGWVLSDLNGTPRRATEWAYTLVKLQEDVRLADLPKWYPATSFGDVGAATGAVATVMAARAFQRGYAPGGAALIMLASERGDRGAMLVKREA